ncbi:4Fe-4S binding protein [bacterium]|nr:4Fe-4S binding protein [bacterium]
MIQIAFASGKGGAGKTSISLSFHKYIGENSIMIDTDVDAADAFLLLESQILEAKPFISGWKYKISEKNCVSCGRCISSCSFGAIKRDINSRKITINPLFCEGCGACEDVCSFDAIIKEENYCGDYFISSTKINTTMVYAKLIPGEDNSGKLVHLVRKKGVEIFKKSIQQDGYIVIDSPPGIGCPLMAAISGVNYLAVIIEATESGFHDAKRVIEVAKQLKIPVVSIINKAGLSSEIDNQILLYLKEFDISLMGIIPFNNEFNNILNREMFWIDSDNIEIKNSLISIFDNIINYVKK